MAERRTQSRKKGEFRYLGPLDVPGHSARRVRVYLPPGYSSGQPHNALYFFDGQNLFHDKDAFAGAWRVHEAIDRLHRAKRPAPVVIGIDHGGSSRLDELSPVPFRQSRGQAESFVAWIVDGLMPLLHREFRLIPGPVGAAVAGSSMGGLAAFYAHYHRPDVFGGAICMSPSLWVASNKLLELALKKPRPAISRVYLDCGAHEGRMLGVVERFAKALSGHGYDPSSLMFRADPNGHHREASWRRRLPGALRFMYR